MYECICWCVFNIFYMLVMVLYYKMAALVAGANKKGKLTAVNCSERWACA